MCGLDGNHGPQAFDTGLVGQQHIARRIRSRASAGLHHWRGGDLLPHLRLVAPVWAKMVEVAIECMLRPKKRRPRELISHCWMRGASDEGRGGLW